tara:strand:+ start:4497 stop:4802 length:306 start_codon:yes stop_codon:yes gene_type:complete
MANQTAAERNAEQAARLDRIEEKIDRMSEAIISLARAEEKIITLTSFSKQQSEQIQNVINKVEALEKQVEANASTVNIINRIFWIVMAASATAITGMFLMQ